MLKLEVSGTLWGTHWKSNFPHKENNHKDSHYLETQTAAFSGLAANHTDHHGNLQFHWPSNSNTSKNSSTPSTQVLLLQLKISRHNIINNIGRLNTGKKRADGLRTFGIEEYTSMSCLGFLIPSSMCRTGHVRKLQLWTIHLYRQKSSKKNLFSLTKAPGEQRTYNRKPLG